MKPYAKWIKKPYTSISAIILGCALLLVYTWSCLEFVEKYEACDIKLQRLEEKANKHSYYKKNFDVLHEQLSQSVPHYVENTIETVVFLEQEKKRLEQLNLTQPSLDLHHLHNNFDGNKLKFKEMPISTKGIYKECLYEQIEPVQVNDEDIKKLLCLIEGSTIFPYAPAKGKPQLIIHEFIIDKKSFAPYQNVFNLEMKIFKREKAEHEKKNISLP